MENTRNIILGTNGTTIPVKVDLNVKPLTHSVLVNNKIVKNKPVVTQSGRLVMDDEWIYVNIPNYGNISINVNRSSFCVKQYLSSTSILESIGGKKQTDRLKEFIKTVSDKLVFKSNSITYRVFLKETKKGFDIEKVWPYWATVGTGGISSSWDSVIKKYGGHPGWDYVEDNDFNQPKENWKHKLDVDLNKAFNFNK